MNRYRAIVKRETVDQEIVEVEAPDLEVAALRLRHYINVGTHKGVRVVAPFDQDKNATDERKVARVSLIEE